MDNVLRMKNANTLQKEMADPDPAGAEEAPRTYLKRYEMNFS